MKFILKNIYFKWNLFTKLSMFRLWIDRTEIRIEHNVNVLNLIHNNELLLHIYIAVFFTLVVYSTEKVEYTDCVFYLFSNCY